MQRSMHRHAKGSQKGCQPPSRKGAPREPPRHRLPAGQSGPAKDRTRGGPRVEGIGIFQNFLQCKQVDFPMQPVKLLSSMPS